MEPAAVLIGTVVGFVVGVTSTGRGALLAPALVFVFPLSAPVMVGTVVATLGHLHAGRVDFTHAGSVLAGSVPGVLLGARLAERVPERVLRATLAIVLIGLGLPIAWPGAFSHVQLG
jgi:uncharacterized membrane protein YfcA